MKQTVEIWSRKLRFHKNLNTYSIIVKKKRKNIQNFESWFFSLLSSSLTQRSIGSDSQGRVTAANNQRQLAGDNKKPYNFLPLHVNTNKSKDLLPPSSSAPATPAITKETKKQSPGLRDTSTPLVPTKETPRLSRGGTERGPLVQREYGRGEPRIDSSQVKFNFVVTEILVWSSITSTRCLVVWVWEWMSGTLRCWSHKPTAGGARGKVRGLPK